MSVNDDTPAEPCSPTTLAKTQKNFFNYNDKYFIKLYLDKKSQHIFILCYDSDTIGLENKRYEIKLNKVEFYCLSKFLKMCDYIEQIYNLTYDVFESKRYKIIYSNNDDIRIELYYKTNFENNPINFDFQIQLKPNINEDFSCDYYYILILKKKDNSEIQKELFNLKKEKSELNEEKSKLNAEISELKTDISALKQKIFNLIKEKTELNTDISVLEKEKSSLKNIISNLNTEKSFLEKEKYILKTNHEFNKVNSIKNLYKNKKFISLNKDKSKPNIKPYIDKDVNLNWKKLEIKDLKKMENYPDLKKIIFINDNLIDISILNKLNSKDLKEINFSKNLISNIDVLKDMKFPKLNELNLNNNKITDLETFSQIDLTNIQKIDLSFNYIDDINVFYRVNVPHLEYFNLSSNNIREITIFGYIDSRFNCLKELYLANNPINQDVYSDLLDLLKRKLSKFTC